MTAQAELGSESGSATMDNGIESALVAGGHGVAKASQIGRRMLSDDVRERGHGEDYKSAIRRSTVSWRRSVAGWVTCRYTSVVLSALCPNTD